MAILPNSEAVKVFGFSVSISVIEKKEAQPKDGSVQVIEPELCSLCQLYYYKKGAVEIGESMGMGESVEVCDMTLAVSAHKYRL